jgi:hypothetical protein
MTGMKEGAGEDPFAESAETSSEATESGSESESNESAAGVSEGSESPSIDIPYKFRRDGVQDGRDRVPLFLHPGTKDGEREALRELEDRFGDDVSLTDLREALMMVGLDHLDEVEASLEEWGYGMTFED